MKANILLEKQHSEVSLEKALFCRRIKIGHTGMGDFNFKIAETQAELESAYCLIHDIYVKSGYMSPESHGLRFNFYNAVPYTQTFVGITNFRTIITNTLLPDSQLGLPIDTLYKKEVNVLRDQGRFLAEVGGFASAINNQNVFLHMVKILYLYAELFLKIDDLVITIHPKHSKFYEYALGFEKIGEIKSYSYVNDNPAVALRLDLHKYREGYWTTYPRNPVENDLYHFFFQEDSTSINLPPRKQPLKVWNSTLFNYFFKEKTNLYWDADTKTCEYLNNCYNSTGTSDR